jgi:hypothetical protein
MKNTIKFGLAFILAITLAAVCSLPGCTATPTASDPLAGIEKFNAGVATNLADPKVQAILQEGVKLVDLGLSLDPTLSWIAPINNAGAQVVASLLTAHGLPPTATATLVNLGLTSTGNGKYAPYTAEAISVINTVVNGATPSAPVASK